MFATILSASLMLLNQPDTIYVVDTISKYDSVVFLNEISIKSNAEKEFQLSSSQNKVQVDKEFLENHFAGSLMQSLEEIPGVKAMTIGSGQSKPTIRGLGFNRLAVTENGIKHESQQWGDDHGLEINGFAIDRAEVIKGPSALEYGSDAIGGVLNLYTNHTPIDNFEGSLTLFGRTNNEQLGFATKIGGRSNRFFYRAGISISDYADYKVPTDSIQYYSYWIKLKDKRLRNTAGKEANADILLGYVAKNFHTDLKISDNFSKSGLFANAHGFEVRLSDIDYDKSFRDIDLPSNQVNHLKVMSHTVWSINKFDLESNLSYQNNLRKEFSEPLSHGYMPTPKDSLERQFNKDTYSANFTVKTSLNEKHSMKTGINFEFQHNGKQGWGFIIPDFETFSWGGFAMDNWKVNKQLSINAGIRYDYSKTHIHKYNDWFLTPINEQDSVYKERSSALNRKFNSFTYSLGMIYNFNDFIFKANIGKSFRVPIAKELGADGINYHIFRYEKGNTTLKAEESYQLDMGMNYNGDKLAFEFAPYINYFPNYIYLNPTDKYTEGLQTYCYTQAEVFRYGFEFQLIYTINSYFQTELQGEYLYSRQLSGEKKGYTLPFSTPWSMDYTFKYTFDNKNNGFLSINVHITGSQNEIVPPEKPTKGYCILNLSATKHFALKDNLLKISLQANNLLNKRYYDHTSYYRLIDVPEAGRNVSLLLSLTF
ncbi:MAG: TonB-dependent receptor [Bacteroidales bacterium]|nr:TonB-dependent receptor [Bacteroidales bacterium]